MALMDMDFSSFQMPFMGSMGDFSNNVMAFLNNLSSMSQLEFVGIITIGCAIVVLGISITGMYEEMKIR